MPLPRRLIGNKTPLRRLLFSAARYVSAMEPAHSSGWRASAWAEVLGTATVAQTSEDENCSTQCSPEQPGQRRAVACPAFCRLLGTYVPGGLSFWGALIMLSTRNQRFRIDLRRKETWYNLFVSGDKSLRVIKAHSHSLIFRASFTNARGAAAGARLSCVYRCPRNNSLLKPLRRIRGALALS